MPSDAPTRRGEQPDTAPNDAGAPTRTGVTFAVLALGAMAFTLLQSMVLPALPVLQRDLDTSQSTVTWVLTAYLLSASVATPILGRLGDMFGKKRLLLIVFVALSVGSLLAGVANSVGLLIVARVIQGLGGAVFPLAFGIIRDEFPAKKVAGSIGLMSTMTGIGAGLGTVLAGPVVDNLSWNWLFWIPLVISIMAGIATALFVPKSLVRAPGKINVPAALLLSGWLVCLLLGLSRGSSWGWSAPGTLGLFAGAVVLFTLWMMLENASDEPLVDLRMMRVPAVWWTNVAALLLGFGLYATIVVVPPFLQTSESAGYGFGASVTAAGLFMLPSTIGMILVGLFIGRITHRFGAKPMLVGGAVLAGAPFLVLAFAHASPALFLLAVTAQGFGVGLAFSSMSNLIMDAVPVSQTGIATGMNANIRTIGGSIGSQVVATVVTAGASASGLPQESGYTIGFAILAIAMIAAGFTALGVPRRGRPREPEQTSGLPLARSEPVTLPARIGESTVVVMTGSTMTAATTAPESQAPTKLRCDAARNRERVIAAAADVYAERGQAFTMDEVASRAGVGIGTVYRRFPTKDALLDALARPGFERMLDLARDAAGQADAGDALDVFVRAVVEQHARVGVPFRRVWDASIMPELRGEIAGLLDQVVDGAKQAGRLRPDVGRRDLMVLLWTCCGLVDLADQHAPEVWRRYLDLMLDGLRPQGYTELATAQVEPEAWERVIASTPVYRLR